MPGKKHPTANDVRKYLAKNPTAGYGEIAQHLGRKIEVIKAICKKYGIQVAGDSEETAASGERAPGPRQPMRTIQVVPDGRKVTYREPLPQEIMFPETLMALYTEVYREVQDKLTPEERQIGPPALLLYYRRRDGQWQTWTQDQRDQHAEETRTLTEEVKGLEGQFREKNQALEAARNELRMVKNEFGKLQDKEIAWAIREGHLLEEVGSSKERLAETTKELNKVQDAVGRQVVPQATAFVDLWNGTPELHDQFSSPKVLATAAVELVTAQSGPIAALARAQRHLGDLTDDMERRLLQLGEVEVEREFAYSVVSAMERIIHKERKEAGLPQWPEGGLVYRAIYRQVLQCDPPEGPDEDPHYREVLARLSPDAMMDFVEKGVRSLQGEDPARAMEREQALAVYWRGGS